MLNICFHSFYRKNEYYGHDQPSLSQPEVQVVNHGAASQSIQGHPYSFPTALASYAFENAAQANAAGISSVQTNSQMHNLAHLSSMLVMKIFSCLYTSIPLFFSLLLQNIIHVGKIEFGYLEIYHSELQILGMR